MRFISFLKQRPWLVSAAAVCVLAAGIVGGVGLLGAKTPEVSVPADKKTALPAPQIRILPPDAPASAPQELEEPPAVEAPSELLPSVVSPLDGTSVTVFSMTELLYDQSMADWRTHNGVDIQAGEGDAVKTAAGGTVSAVTKDGLMGTTVVIDHPGGYTTTYASLQEKPPVNEGQSVAAGDIIGYVGTTAAAEMSMGPHLHFSVSRDGESIDPEEYIK